MDSTSVIMSNIRKRIEIQTLLGQNFTKTQVSRAVGVSLPNVYKWSKIQSVEDDDGRTRTNDLVGLVRLLRELNVKLIDK